MRCFVVYYIGSERENKKRNEHRKQKNAAMAQLVERVLGKDEVISSTLISSSKIPDFGQGFLFSFLKSMNDR